MRRIDEKPPEDHWRKRFPEMEVKLLDDYYKFKGWNNEGIPTKETLDELGLDYVGQDLEQRGVYKEKAKVAKSVSKKETSQPSPGTKSAPKGETSQPKPRTKKDSKK
jgi:hypothetical protein